MVYYDKAYSGMHRAMRVTRERTVTPACQVLECIIEEVILEPSLEEW